MFESINTKIDDKKDVKFKNLTISLYNLKCPAAKLPVRISIHCLESSVKNVITTSLLQNNIME